MFQQKVNKIGNFDCILGNSLDHPGDVDGVGDQSVGGVQRRGANL